MFLKLECVTVLGQKIHCLRTVSSQLSRISKDADFTTTLAVVPVSSRLYIEKVFPHVEMEPSVFQLVPTVFCPLDGHQ